MSSPHLVFADLETVSVIPGPATIWEIALIDRPADGGKDRGYAWQIRPDLIGADPASLMVGGYYERCRARRHARGSAVRVAAPNDEFGERPEPWWGDSGELAAEIAEMLAGAHLVSHNAAFDDAHLDAWLMANGQCLAADYHLVDIGSLVRGWARERVLPFPLSLNHAASVVGIDPASYDRHTAMGDACLHRDIYDAVTGWGDW
jgi:hypothetical protein